MNTHPTMPRGKTLLVTFLGFFWLIGTARAFAEIEIDLDEAIKPSPTPANASHKMPTAVPTPVPQKQPETQSTPTPEAEVTMEEPSPTPEVVHGVFKMKDMYEAGMKAYKEKDYDRAIRYLKKAVTMKDKRTPKFYYAEAYAMLGVIYQFHIIRYKTAYAYYKAALKYERRNATARKHIREVARKLHKRY